jgi:hypothetical protein
MSVGRNASELEKVAQLLQIPWVQLNLPEK